MKMDEAKNASVGTLISTIGLMNNDRRRLEERYRMLERVLNNKIYAGNDGLLSSHLYKNLLPYKKEKICNGAGAAGQWISSFIPNTMYGLDCTEAFNIHDFDYYIGQRREDKENADRRLLDNLLILINCKGGLLQWLRRRRAMKYYEAVHQWGDNAFFKGEK